MSETPAATHLPTDASPPRARTFGLFGTKGGCGTSLLACHLAAAAAEDRVEAEVALVDFDFHRGDLLPMLGLRAPSTLSDLLALGSDLSVDAVRTAAVPHTSDFQVLGQPSSYDQLSEVDVDSSRHLHHVLTEAYDTVVFDLGSHIDVSSIVALRQVDRVVLVSANRPLDLHNLQRMLLLLQRLGVQEDRIRYVLCPYDPRHTTLGEVEDHLPIAVSAVVREDRGTTRDLDLRARLAYDDHPFSPYATDARRVWQAIRGAPMPLEMPQARRWPWSA